jgi:hypothetical protein
MSYHALTNGDRTQQQPGPRNPQPTQPIYSREDIRNALKHVVDTQEKLSRSREGLVIERERLRTSGSRVRKKRIDAGDAEAAFMSILRGYINELRNSLPTSLIEAYNKVELLRNELGVLEEDFLQSEIKLAGTEWRFLDEENDFYQFELLELLDDALPENLSNTCNSYEQNKTPTSMNSQRPLFPITLPVPPPPPVDFLPASHQGSLLPQHLPPPPQLPLFTGHMQPAPHFLAPLTPRVMLQPPSPEHASLQSLENRDYDTVTAELATLRRNFDTLRQMQADQMITVTNDDLLMDDVSNNFQRELEKKQERTKFEETYFRILQQISDHEVEAQRLKNEVMFRELQRLVVPRRCSDPTHFAGAATAPSVF